MERFRGKRHESTPDIAMFSTRFGFPRDTRGNFSQDLWDSLKESDEETKFQKDFERVRLNFRERFSSYKDRVVKIATNPRFADTTSKFQTTTKLILLSDSFDDAAPVMDQLMAMQNLTFKSLLELIDTFESETVETFYEILKVLMEVGSSSDCEAITKMFISLSDSYVDSVSPVMEDLQTCHRLRKHLGVLESLPTEAICRMLKRLELGSSSQAKEDIRRNQQTPARKVEKQKQESRNEKVLPEYQMYAFDIGHRTYDEDMWMVYSTTSNHMSPYEKYFMTLDRTHKARIKFITGDTIMSEGIGDVVIMTDRGKKTIKNVLFVPKIHRNVLSIGQMTQQGYGILMSVEKCTIEDQTGRLFGEAMWEEERGYFLRLNVVEVNLTS